MTWTSYTYGRGFADVHRRFAQAYLALPDLPGEIVEDALRPPDRDIRARRYAADNAVYVGVVSRKTSAKTFDLAIPAPGRTVVDLVTGATMPARVADDRLTFEVRSNAMELNSFLIRK